MLPTLNMVGGTLPIQSNNLTVRISELYCAIYAIVANTNVRVFYKSTTSSAGGFFSILVFLPALPSSLLSSLSSFSSSSRIKAFIDHFITTPLLHVTFTFFPLLSFHPATCCVALKHVETSSFTHSVSPICIAIICISRMFDIATYFTEQRWAVSIKFRCFLLQLLRK